MTGVVPHNLITLNELPPGQQTSLGLLLIAQLGLSIRNLRNLLFDNSTGLCHVKSVELMIDRNAAIDLINMINSLSKYHHHDDGSLKECLKSVVGDIWMRNFGTHRPNEAFKLCQKREAQIWDHCFGTVESSLTGDDNLSSDVGTGVGTVQCVVRFSSMPMGQLVILRGIARCAWCT